MFSLFLLVVATARADTAADVWKQIQAWKSSRIAEAPPRVTETHVRRALGGERVADVEIVESITAGKGFGLAVYDFPIETTWKAVNDTPHFPGYVPIQVSKAVKGTARADGHILYQYMELPVVSDRWWMVLYKFNGNLYRQSAAKAWEVAWYDRTNDADLRASLDPGLFDDGVPVAWTKGAWLVVDLGGGRSLVEYHVWTDPGGALPAGPASRFAAGEIVNTLNGIARFASEHIPSCTATFRRPDGQGM